jgi:hypothetical protein
MSAFHPNKSDIDGGTCWECGTKRDIIIQRGKKITELEKELETEKNTRVDWQQRAWIAEAELDRIRPAAQAEIDAQQDRYAANSDEELFKANAKYEISYDNLAAALEEKS